MAQIFDASHKSLKLSLELGLGVLHNYSFITSFLEIFKSCTLQILMTLMKTMEFGIFKMIAMGMDSGNRKKFLFKSGKHTTQSVHKKKAYRIIQLDLNGKTSPVIRNRCP